MKETDLPIGTRVTYWGVIKENGDKYYPFDTHTTCPHWRLPSGELVVMVEGKSGCVAINHLEAMR